MNYLEEYKKWMNSTFIDEETKKELNSKGYDYEICRELAKIL